MTAFAYLLSKKSENLYATFPKISISRSYLWGINLLRLPFLNRKEFEVKQASLWAACVKCYCVLSVADFFKTKANNRTSFLQNYASSRSNPSSIWYTRRLEPSLQTDKRLRRSTFFFLSRAYFRPIRSVRGNDAEESIGNFAGQRKMWSVPRKIRNENERKTAFISNRCWNPTE